MLKLVSDIVAIIRAVRDVAINKEVRVPVGPEPQPCARLRRIGLHIITVQIETHGGRPPAHFRRAVLIDAIVGARTLVPVRVVDRDEQYDDMIEQTRARLCNGNVAQERQPGVFTVRLTRMYASLYENPCLTGAP